jgi:hypothetical protein
MEPLLKAIFTDNAVAVKDKATNRIIAPLAFIFRNCVCGRLEHYDLFD